MSEEDEEWKGERGESGESWNVPKIRLEGRQE